MAADNRTRPIAMNSDLMVSICRRGIRIELSHKEKRAGLRPAPTNPDKIGAKGDRIGRPYRVLAETLRRKEIFFRAPRLCELCEKKILGFFWSACGRAAERLSSAAGFARPRPLERIVRRSSPDSGC